MKQYECMKCWKLIPEDEGITCTNGKWVCDDESCRTLDEENEAYYKED
jgi:ribosomal protein S26